MDRLAERGDGGIVESLSLEDLAEGIVAVGVAGIEDQRLAERRGRLHVPPPSAQHEPHAPMELGVVRSNGPRRAVYRDGVVGLTKPLESPAQTAGGLGGL